jgi:hypothetical protein
MALTLATAKTSIEIHLHDVSNLIFSEITLEEAIRSALRALNRIRGYTLTISGLDGAASTTVTPTDEQAIIDGGVAYALNFRAVGLFDEPTPDEDLPEEFSELAQKRMNDFLSLLTQLELGVPVSADDHTHDLAMQDDQQSHELAIQSADQAHDLAVIAAKHANEQEIISDKNAREDAAKAAEAARIADLQAAEDPPYSEWDWDEGSDFA